MHENSIGFGPEKNLYKKLRVEKKEIEYKSKNTSLHFFLKCPETSTMMMNLMMMLNHGKIFLLTR